MSNIRPNSLQEPSEYFNSLRESTSRTESLLVPDDEESYSPIAFVSDSITNSRPESPSSEPNKAHNLLGETDIGPSTGLLESTDFADYHSLHTTMSNPVQKHSVRDRAVRRLFLTGRIFKPMVFENGTSEARDLYANERNFMAWIRLSLYLGLAGSFVLLQIRLENLTHKPEDKLPFDERLAKPLGIFFFILSIIGLFIGINSYAHAMVGFAKQHSEVVTSRAAHIYVLVIAITIVAANIFLLIEMKVRGITGGDG